MSNTTDEIKWKDIVELYNTIKWLYAECEETDPDLNTNLQPYNEFRAALDHLMRIVAIQNLDEYKHENAEEQSRSLYGHLKRIYFDICDMLSINYRNKIIDLLEPYSPEEIKTAIPSYYAEMRPRIEEITSNISYCRIDGRFGGKNREYTIDSYSGVVMQLKEYCTVILRAYPSLCELHDKQIQKEKRQKRTNLFTQWIIQICAIAVAIVIAILF